jgi:hypothetical protein
MVGRRRVTPRSDRWLTVPVAVLALLTGAWGTGPADGARTAAGQPIVPAGFHLAGAPPSSTAPLRFWVLGDSVMHDGSPALAAALAATGEATVVADSSFGGWGLTQVPAWAADSQQIIADYHPQVVIGTWSWDDTMARTEPAAYLALLRQALGVWLAPCDGVALVVLVQFPQIGPNTLTFQPAQRARLWATLTLEQRAWDEDARAVVADFPGRAVYLSTDQLFAPDGRFLTWAALPGGRFVRMRQVDNIHLCPFGAAAFATLIVDDLETVLGLPAPATGWQFGPWTDDPRYSVGVGGPGACPADQPAPGYQGLSVPKELRTSS